jgi:hypothetical protein
VPSASACDARGAGHGKDMSSYSIEDYTIVKHVMAKIAD